MIHTGSFDKGIYKDCVFSLDFKEGSGNPNDNAKAHHPMTMPSAPTWTTVSPAGIAVNVLDFNGAANYIQCAAASAVDLKFNATRTFTVALWINPDTSPGAFRRVIGKGNNGWNFDSYLTGIYWGGPGYPVRADLAYFTGVWQMIALTDNNGAGKFYRNGIEPTYVLQNAVNPGDTADDFAIGGYAAGTFTDGKMYHPRIWSRALSPQEIWYIFQRERRLFGV